MANVTKASKTSVNYLETTAEVETNKQHDNCMHVVVTSNDNTASHDFNTNTWDGEDIIMLADMVSMYRSGEITWHTLTTWDDSKAVSDNRDSIISNKYRKYVRESYEVGKGSIETIVEKYLSLFGEKIDTLKLFNIDRNIIESMKLGDYYMTPYLLKILKEELKSIDKNIDVDLILEKVRG